MTVALYARRKQWPLQDVTVQLQHSRIHAADCVECETKEGMLDRIDRGDRKSTRLNSSHSQISYAVFCLKKKKTTHITCAPFPLNHQQQYRLFNILPQLTRRSALRHAHLTCRRLSMRADPHFLLLQWRTD